MTELLELFDGAKNVEFKEFTYVKEVQAEIPVFTLTDIPVEDWNRRARIQNTKTFVEITGRLPVDYKEVLNWINSYTTENKKEVTSC